LSLIIDRLGDPRPRRETRSGLQNIPPHGFSFVEFGTKTIVRGEKKTMLIFKPRRMHGTTVGHRVFQLATSLTNSLHIHEARLAAEDGKVTRNFETRRFAQYEEL
jgi:hypothetical protein